MTNNIMTDQSSIERTVMHRVQRMYILRYVFSGVTASCLLLLLTLYGIGRAVWVARVFENAPQDFAAALQFYLAAFSQTELIVQALTLLTLLSAFYLARATARIIASALNPVRI